MLLTVPPTAATHKSGYLARAFHERHIDLIHVADVYSFCCGGFLWSNPTGLGDVYDSHIGPVAASSSDGYFPCSGPHSSTPSNAHFHPPLWERRSRPRPRRAASEPVRTARACRAGLWPSLAHDWNTVPARAAVAIHARRMALVEIDGCGIRALGLTRWKNCCSSTACSVPW